MVDNNDGDFITILSSDMIAQIVEVYFNKQMYKQPVKIVDLKPSGDNGYMFSLMFTPRESKVNPTNNPGYDGSVVHEDEDAIKGIIETEPTSNNHRLQHAAHIYTASNSDNSTNADSNIGYRDNKGRFTKVK